MANKDYIAKERLYLDKDGKVVKADDPKRLTLLVAEGGRLPAARADELGLKVGAKESPEDEAEAIVKEQGSSSIAPAAARPEGRATNRAASEPTTEVKKDK
jgi:hypothetical protein